MSSRTPAAQASDPSEISATAQALLQAHYGRLKHDPTSSSSNSSALERMQLSKLEQAAANIDRVCLQLDNLQVAQQLHTGKSSADKATRTLQPLGPLAFWPARLVTGDDTIFVRQDVPGLSVPDQLLLEDEALPALTSRRKTGDKISVQVRLTEPSRTVEVQYLKMSLKDAQKQLQARKARYLSAAAELRRRVAPKTRTDSHASNNNVTGNTSDSAHVVNQDDQVLNEEGLPFYEPVEQITEEEATRNKKAYMQPFVRSDDKLAADKDQRRRWVDDMLSKFEEEEKDEESDEEEADQAAASTASSSITQRDTEQGSPVDATPSAAEETRVVLRTRTPSPPASPNDLSKLRSLPEIVSAARPPPPKSALKPTAARPAIEQRPSFGSAGIRHGFLNLNPSSPGAIKSSYSWEDLEKEEKKQKPTKPAESERPSRSHTPTPLSRESSTMTSSLLGRVTGVGPSPMTSGTSTPTKKSVRIKSPERAHPEAAAGSGLTPLQRALRSSIRVKENYTEPSTSSQPGTDASSMMARALESGSGTAEKRHRDDVGVEEEAERIVKLLGPDVVEGHPSAPPSDVLKKMQEAHEEDKRFSTPEAIAARAKHEEEERERERLQRLAEKPALGQTVLERPTQDKGKGVETQVKAQQGKFSAFKQGFLNQKPGKAKFVPNAPSNVGRKPAIGSGVSAAPTESLGMSALDRASLGDDELSQRRQAMGLPAAVPHARPSKAYAEKMRQRQEGAPPSQKDASAGTSGDKEVKLARPVADDDVPRPGRVRFGPPAGKAGDDEDDEQAHEINPSMTLDNHLSEDIDDGRELDEEQEEPKIEGEGADTDEEDAYFDSYLSKRSRRAAASDSRGLDIDQDDDMDEDDEDDWHVDEDDFDDDGDDDFDYDPEDLMALAPKMGADADSLASYPELMREYEEARAKLAAMGLAMPSGGGDQEARAAMEAAARGGGMEGEEEADDYEMDVVPVDAAVEDAEYQGNTTSSGSRISRFKASLAQRSSTNKLEDLLSSAQNLGSSQPSSAAFDMDGRSPTTGTPMMIIPSLAPVRFPKNGDLVDGNTGPVELDGAESDENDDKAEMVMRSRLERLEWKQEHPEEAKRLKESRRVEEMVQQGVKAPEVGRRGVKDEGGEAEEAEVKPKKVSRFKAARMGQ